MILFLRDSLLLPYAVFKVRLRGFLPGLVPSLPLGSWVTGGLKWTRTTDLALIRRAL